MTPTYLYIKRHELTDKYYFGRTTKENIHQYKGSGTHWLRHIKKHGPSHVKTLWVSEPFYDVELLQEFALFFSSFFDIVDSTKWLNLQEENGMDGAPKGVYRKGASGPLNGMYGKTGSLNPFFGKKHSDEQKHLWSEMRKGDRNPNYKAKSFTEHTRKLLKRPKSSKENYKGTPGKITCIDKQGKAIQITTEQYHKQKEIYSSISDWDYVNTRSKEAQRRRQNNGI
jgi:hypothetical protein